MKRRGAINAINQYSAGDGGAKDGRRICWSMHSVQNGKTKESVHSLNSGTCFVTFPSCHLALFHWGLFKWASFAILLPVLRTMCFFDLDFSLIRAWDMSTKGESPCSLLQMRLPSQLFYSLPRRPFAQSTRPNDRRHSVHAECKANEGEEMREREKERGKVLQQSKQEAASASDSDPFRINELAHRLVTPCFGVGEGRKSSQNVRQRSSLHN